MLDKKFTRDPAAKERRRAPEEPAPERPKSAGRRIALVFVILILAAAVGALLLYFFAKVESITVTGNERYSENDVINLSGLYTGKNIFLYDLGAAKREIEKDPYIRVNGIRRVFPHGLAIDVSEREEYAAIVNAGGTFAIIDSTGLILSIERRTSISGLIPVQGLSSMGYSVGTRIDADKSKLRPYTLLQILEGIGDRRGDITYIDISNTSNVKIGIKGELTVMLGDSVDIPSKVERMFRVLELVDPAKTKGTILYINSTGSSDISYPTPVPTETPEPTYTPEPTEEPVETDDPDNTGEPSDTDAPDETEAPEETETPSDTEEPAETGEG